MPAELDHVYVWVSAGGPEAEQLAALGLTEGSPNRHPGQGTACRRFFFANAYLELLWVESPEEAQGEVARPFRFWERWSGRHTGSSPFGILLRPGPEDDPAPPFPTWEYRPPYLPPGSLPFYVGTNVERVEEPALLYIPRHRTPAQLAATNPQPLEHAAGFRQLTALRIFGPHPAGSVVMRATEQTGAVVFHQAAEHFAEIGFDEETQGRRADLRPALPLVLCW